MFKAIDVNAVTADIEVLAKGEQDAKRIINLRAPEIASGLHAGDNMVTANRLIQACVGGRSKEVLIFLRHVSPYDYDKATGLFTKKHASADKVKEKENNLVAFTKSGLTVFGWLAGNVKVEKAEPDWKGNYIKKLKSTAKHIAHTEMLKLFFENVDGLSAEQVAQVFGAIAGEKANKPE